MTDTELQLVQQIQALILQASRKFENAVYFNEAAKDVALKAIAELKEIQALAEQLTKESASARLLNA